MFEVFEGGVGFALGFEDFAEFVEDADFFVIHGGEFFGGFGELGGGDVELAFLFEAGAHEVEGIDAALGVALGLLELGDGFVEFAGLHEEAAVVEFEAEVVGVAGDFVGGVFEEEGLHFRFLGGGGFEVAFGGEDFDIVFVDLDGDAGDGALDDGVGVVGFLVGAVEDFEGLVVLFVFDEGVGEGAVEVEVVGFGLEFFALGVDHALEVVAHELGAGALFEGGGFVLVFEFVAEVAFGLPVAGAHGVHGGGVFDPFDDGLVAGAEVAEFFEGFAGFVAVAEGDVEVAEFFEEFVVFAVLFEDGGEGDGGGAGVFGGVGGLAVDIMEGGVVEIDFEEVLGEDEGFGGVFFDGGLDGHFFAHAFEAGEGGVGFFAFELFELDFAEFGADVVEFRFEFEDGEEEVDGVGGVIFLQGLLGAFVGFADTGADVLHCF